LRTLANMGGEYADAVEVIRRADRLHVLSCPVAVDALPQATSVYDLANAAADTELLKTHPDILDARADFGATPTLFEKGKGRKGSGHVENASANGAEYPFLFQAPGGYRRSEEVTPQIDGPGFFLARFAPCLAAPRREARR